jgi:hypothetical protein
MPLVDIPMINNRTHPSVPKICSKPFSDIYRPMSSPCTPYSDSKICLTFIGIMRDSPLNQIRQLLEKNGRPFIPVDVVLYIFIQSRMKPKFSDIKRILQEADIKDKIGI